MSFHCIYPTPTTTCSSPFSLELDSSDDDEGVILDLSQDIQPTKSRLLGVFIPKSVDSLSISGRSLVDLVNSCIVSAEITKNAQDFCSGMPIKSLTARGGTYSISGVPSIFQNIAEYINGTPSKFKASPTGVAGVFKVGDEARGGRNSTTGTRAKYGIDSLNEKDNEHIASILFDIGHEVIPGRLESDSFQSNGAKEGVLLPFISGATDLNQMGKKEKESVIQKMDLQALQSLTILDIALHNTDRNPGNLLVDKNGSLHPIDHGLILPAHFLSHANFCWMNFDQVRKPLLLSTFNKILHLDFKRDLEKIQKLYPNYPKDSLDVMELSYHLLKQGEKKGLTPFEIAAFLTNSSDYTHSPIRTIFDTVKSKAETMNQIDHCIDFLEKKQLVYKNKDMKASDLKQHIEDKIIEFFKSRLV